MHNRGSSEFDLGWLAGWGSFAVHATAVRGTGRRSLENYHDGVRNVARFLEGRGRRGWGDVAGADMRAYAVDSIVARGLARSTVAGRRVGAAQYLHHIGRHDLADAMVVASPRYYRRYGRQPIVLDGDQASVLVEVPGSSPAASRDRAALALLHATGMRAHELCGLSLLQALELVERGKVTIRGKGGKEREVLVGPRTQAVVRQYCMLVKGPRHRLASSTPTRRGNQATQGNRSALLLGDHGARLTLDGLRRIVARAGARIGEPGLTPLDLRHTFATLMYAGFTAQAIETDTAFMYLGRLMGHDKPDTTQIYVHVAATELDRATRLLQRD